MGTRENELQDIIRNTLEYHEVVVLIAEMDALGAELARVKAQLRTLRQLSAAAVKLAKADAQRAPANATGSSQNQKAGAESVGMLANPPAFLPDGLTALQFNRRLAEFLAVFGRNIPWERLDSLVRPAYLNEAWPAPRLSVSSMVRLYFLQQWCSLSNEAIPQRIRDCRAMSDFAGIVPQALPTPVVLLRFKRMLDSNGLTEQIKQIVIDECGFHDKPAVFAAGECMSLEPKAFSRRSTFN